MAGGGGKVTPAVAYCAWPPSIPSDPGRRVKDESARFRVRPSAVPRGKRSGPIARKMLASIHHVQSEYIRCQMVSKWTERVSARRRPPRDRRAWFHVRGSTCATSSCVQRSPPGSSSSQDGVDRTRQEERGVRVEGRCVCVCVCVCVVVRVCVCVCVAWRPSPVETWDFCWAEVWRVRRSRLPLICSSTLWGSGARRTESSSPSAFHVRNWKRSEKPASSLPAAAAVAGSDRKLALELTKVVATSWGWEQEKVTFPWRAEGDARGSCFCFFYAYAQQNP